MRSAGAALPSVPGVLDTAQVAATAATIAAVQEDDGAIPWCAGDRTDVWNHVEAAMGLLVGGEVEAAERAYERVPGWQRADGSFPTALLRGEVVDPAGESNMSAYVAAGVWHHWLARQDQRFVAAMWPTVRGALDWVVSQQLPFGGIAWCRRWQDGAAALGSDPAGALLTGSSSIYHSLRAGVALSELVGDPRPAWQVAGGRLGHALRDHRDRFLDKTTFSMDWYYPVLGGAVRGAAARSRLRGRWDDFVVPGLGVRCVDTNPWVTGAETCELVLALDVLGQPEQGRDLLSDMQHLRDDAGAYRTGWVYGDDAFWPEERTTYTAAAALLAVDALGASFGSATGGSGIMRGASLAPHFEPLLLRCGCAWSEAGSSGDRLPGPSSRSA